MSRIYRRKQLTKKSLLTAAFVSTVFFNSFGATYSIRIILITEAICLPASLRFLLKDYLLQHTRSYLFVNFFYYLTFVPTRGIIYLWTLISAFRANSASKVCLISSALVILIDYFELRDLIFEIPTLLSQMQERSQRKIDYWWLEINPDITQLQYIKNPSKIKHI